MARGHLDGLADCLAAEVLKKGCKNCDYRNSGVRSLRNCEWYIEKRIVVIFLIAFSLLIIRPYV